MSATGVQPPDSQATSFCSVCSSLNFKAPWSGTLDISLGDGSTRYIEGIYRVEIERNQQDCRFCDLLRKVLPIYLDDWTFCDLQLEPDKPVAIQVCNKTLNVGVELYAPSDSSPEELPWEDCARANEIAPHSMSEGVFDFVRACWQRCMRDHKDCMQPPETSLPTRVVYISPREPVLRLVEGQGRNEAYSALSHCWGKVRMLTTTIATISARKINIEWDSLPRTFQDAVTVTKKLGISYLWVDSLCILQDDRTDWEIESAKMAEVYRNASVTIAAASSSNGETAFLVPRPGSSIATSDFDFVNEQGRSTVVRTRRKGQACVSNFELDDPLNTRAWSLQERLLSTRILHYTSREMMWECRTMNRCECQTRMEPSQNIWTGEGFGNIGRLSPYKNWHLLVHAYTHRQLSYASDKLPALSGLASIIHGLTSSRYMAGLWADNLLDDLRWRIWGTGLDEFAAAKPAAPYRGPSFSWVSVEGTAIHYDFVDFIPGYTPAPCRIFDARLLDATCTLSGHDRFGGVSNGSITISGLLLRLFLIGQDPTQQQQKLYTNQAAEDGQTAHWVEDTTFELDTPLAELTFNVSGQEIKRLRRVPREEAKRPLAAPVWLLGLYTDNGSREGLVLELSATDDGTYERIGVIREPNTAWFEGAQRSVVTIV